MSGVCKETGPGYSETIVCALAALFYSIHPLRVEAVGWLATRGYLLGTALGLCTCLLYLKAVSQKRYPFFALFCFGLLTCTKGIGMMIPPALLVLDWFPLRRMTSVRKALGCVVEKIPFFVLSLVAGGMAFLAKNQAGGMASVVHYGFWDRIGQAVFSIWFYVGKTVLPVKLSPLYYRSPEAGQLAVVFLLTAFVCVALFLFRRKLRPLLAAAGASLLLIFPMLGLTQSGAQLFADRFTYLAAVPFSVLLAAGLARLSVSKRVIYGGVAALLCLIGGQSFVWSACWQSSLTLWSSAVAIDEESPQAQNSLGLAFKNAGAYERSLEHFVKAIRLNPGYIQAWHNRSVVLAIIGRTDEAVSGWDICFALPGISKTERLRMRWVRGWVLEQNGDPEAAEQDYSAVINDPDCDPDLCAGVLLLRAELYAQTGRHQEAVSDLQMILTMPDPSGTRHEKARVLMDSIAGE